MSALHSDSIQKRARADLATPVANRSVPKGNVVRLRICLLIPTQHQQERMATQMINQLSVDCGVAVRILTTVPMAWNRSISDMTNQLHLELVGSIEQIHNILHNFKS